MRSSIIIAVVLLIHVFISCVAYLLPYRVIGVYESMTWSGFVERCIDSFLDSSINSLSSRDLFKAV